MQTRHHLSNSPRQTPADRRSTIRRGAALLAGAALVVAACGGDDDDVADLSVPDTVDTVPVTTMAEASAPDTSMGEATGTSAPDTTMDDTMDETTGTSAPDTTETSMASSTSEVITEGLVCAASEEGGPLDTSALADMDAASVLGQIDDASTFLFAAEQADLIDRFQTGEDLTLFVPTDEAFDQIPEDEMEQLLTDHLELTSLVLDHVVMGRYTSDQLEDGMTLQTATEGEQWLVNVGDDGEIMVAGSAATVVCPDIPASNAVIHLIDQVIITPAGIG